MIEPEWVELRGLAGVEVPRLPASSGLHVISGPNHAGKTRVLRALQAGHFGTTIRLTDVSPTLVHYRHAILKDDVWHQADPLRLTWPRALHIPPIQGGVKPPYGTVPEEVALHSDDKATLLRRWPGLDGPGLLTLRAELWLGLRSRPATVVPTNRYFDQAAEVQDVPDLATLAEWPVMLANLDRGDDVHRQSYDAIRTAFREITEGFEIRIDGARQIRPSVYGNGRPARPLDDCGDGLRDLIGILLHAIVRPNDDLLIDEPGLRLHPRTRRRLLHFLEQHARDRSVWLASHDGVFLGAPVVRSRYYVRPIPGEERSVVEVLADRDATRMALVDLGWEPADALLADRVLFCEGPSDRIAFEAARSWLEEDDATWGGLVVATLDGDGAVLAEDPELRHRIELAQRVAPRAELVVLLDSGGRTAQEQERIARRLTARGESPFRTWADRAVA